MPLPERPGLGKPLHTSYILKSYILVRSLIIIIEAVIILHPPENGLCELLATNADLDSSETEEEFRHRINIVGRKVRSAHTLHILHKQEPKSSYERIDGLNLSGGGAY